MQPQAPMRFRIGSATKTFVATTVLQLVAEHRITLDDKVEDLIPDVFAGARSGTAPITLRTLLNHTSGLYDYTRDPLIEQTVVADPAHCFTPRALVDAAMGHPASFPPGTSWAYYNTNYTALALVIEKITGRSYGEETTRRILLDLMLTPTPGSFPGTRTLRYGLGVVIVTASCGVTVYGHLNNDLLEPTQFVTGAVDAQYCAARPGSG